MNRSLHAVLIIASAVLLFWRLDGTPLWRDEATTANWARQMAESGVWLPYTVDGDQLIAQAPDGHDFNADFLPAMQGWLQFYVAAASFKLLGADTWSARLPFALAGAAALLLFYRLGRLLFGRGRTCLLLPLFGLSSVHLLSSARQSRYYILVILAAAWLIYEFARYLKDSSLSREWMFFLRLGLAGLTLYAANYVSFGGMWASLGIFALLTKDWTFVRRFAALSAVLAAITGVEFWLVHTDFVQSGWVPQSGDLWEQYRGSLVNRGRDLWRAIPLVVLVPLAAWLTWTRIPSWLRACGIAAVFIVWSPLLFGYNSVFLRKVLTGPEYWLFAAACAMVPMVMTLLWLRAGSTSVESQVMVLAVAIVLVSPLLSVAVGKSRINTRHFLQVAPAAVLLCAIAARAAYRRSRVTGVACTTVLLAWPWLDLNMGGFNHSLPRQFLRDNSYSGPALEYLRERVRPGDQVAVHRNVKGMTLYFYLPEMRWAGLLDSTLPRNIELRSRLPADQFDDFQEADWVVLWDTRGQPARGLTPQHRAVWHYTYTERQSWWEWGNLPRTRTYRVYRRMDPPSGPPDS